MQLKDREEEEQWNGQNIMKLKYHFERVVEKRRAVEWPEYNETKISF